MKTRLTKFYQENKAFTVILICAIFAFGAYRLIQFAIATSFLSSEVYKQVVEKIETDTQLQEIVGTPVRIEKLLTGNINKEFESTSSESNLKLIKGDFHFKISGPKSKGEIFIEYKKEGDVLEFSRCEFLESDGNRVINLLASASK